MADPTRPVAGAPIDTDWGQQVHDRVFQPKGVRCHNAGTQTVNTTFEQLQLDIVDDDPGGWLDDDKYVVPSGAGGLYAFWLRVSSDGAGGADYCRVELRLNGTAYASVPFPLETAVVLTSMGGLIDLSAGDELEVYSRVNEGTAVVVIRQFDLLIQGTSIGA